MTIGFSAALRLWAPASELRNGAVITVSVFAALAALAALSEVSDFSAIFCNVFVGGLSVRGAPPEPKRDLLVGVDGDDGLDGSFPWETSSTSTPHLRYKDITKILKDDTQGEARNHMDE